MQCILGYTSLRIKTQETQYLETHIKNILQLDNVDGELATHFVDAGSPAKGNWLRYVNCARNEQEENLNVVFCDDLVFYITSKDIAPNTELLMWYGTWYGNLLGIKRVHPGYSF